MLHCWVAGRGFISPGARAPKSRLFPAPKSAIGLTLRGAPSDPALSFYLAAHQSVDCVVYLGFVFQGLTEAIRQLDQYHPDIMSHGQALFVAECVQAAAQRSMQQRERVVAVDEQSLR